MFFFSPIGHQLKAFDRSGGVQLMKKDLKENRKTLAINLPHPPSHNPMTAGVLPLLFPPSPPTPLLPSQKNANKLTLIFSYIVIGTLLYIVVPVASFLFNCISVCSFLWLTKMSCLTFKIIFDGHVIMVIRLTKPEYFVRNVIEYLISTSTVTRSL